MGSYRSHLQFQSRFPLGKISSAVQILQPFNQKKLRLSWETFGCFECVGEWKGAESLIKPQLVGPTHSVLPELLSRAQLRGLACLGDNQMGRTVKWARHTKPNDLDKVRPPLGSVGQIKLKCRGKSGTQTEILDFLVQKQDRETNVLAQFLFYQTFLATTSYIWYKSSFFLLAQALVMVTSCHTM